MPFKLFYLSQKDPRWGNDILGTGTTTLSYEGCAVTSVAMLLSGYGFHETPQSLNEKLKAVRGFSNGSGIVWGAVSKLHSTVKADPGFTITAADLRKMDESLANGKPVVVGVDRSVEEGFLSHYVLVYARKGEHYVMLDPIRQPGTPEADYLMTGYSYNRPIQEVIQRLVFYEAPGAGGQPIPPDAGISEPSSLPTYGTANQPTRTPSPKPAAGGQKSKLVVTVQKSGLPIYESIKGKGKVLSTEKMGVQLLVMEDARKATAIIGQPGKWLKVKASNSKRGFVDAGSVKMV